MNRHYGFMAQQKTRVGRLRYETIYIPDFSLRPPAVVSLQIIRELHYYKLRCVPTKKKMLLGLTLKVFSGGVL